MKNRIYIASAALGLGLAFWLRFDQTPSPSLVESKRIPIEKNVEIIDEQAMSAEFERLKSKADSRTHYQHEVEAVKKQAEEYVESSHAIHRQRELLLAGKPLVNGKITLTDDERTALEELNQKAERIQKTFLASYHSIKR